MASQVNSTEQLEKSYYLSLFQNIAEKGTLPNSFYTATTALITKPEKEFQCNSCQNTKDIFHRTKTNNSKICVEMQNTLQIAKTILRKKNKTGDIVIF